MNKTKSLANPCDPAENGPIHPDEVNSTGTANHEGRREKWRALAVARAAAKYGAMFGVRLRFKSRSSSSPAGDRGLPEDSLNRPRRGPGRPSAWTPELGRTICGLIVDGLSLRAICERPGMPDRRTVFRWLASREEFCHQYSLARVIQADLLLDECLEIADDSSGDIIRHVTKNGRDVERVNYGHIRRAKLRVAVRKWMVGRLAPKKYGERLRHGFRDPGGNGIGIQPAVILTIGPGP